MRGAGERERVRGGGGKMVFMHVYLNQIIFKVILNKSA